MSSPPTPPTRVPLIRMHCRALPVDSSIRSAVACVSHPVTVSLILVLPPGTWTHRRCHMMQVSAGALLLVGSVMLALPPSVSARCSVSGATFRCDPIISDALRKRPTPGYTNPYSRSRGTFTYEGWTYRTGTGANLSRSTYFRQPGEYLPRPDRDVPRRRLSSPGKLAITRGTRERSRLRGGRKACHSLSSL